MTMNLTQLHAGDALTPFGPISMSLEDSVRWAAASGDYTAFHFDPEAAAERGFEGAVVHGPWKAAALRALVRQWLGDVILRSFSVRYLAPDLIGQPMTFGGRIAGIDQTDDGAKRITCELWADQQDGTRSLSGDCIVTAVEHYEQLPIERVKQSVKLGEVAGVFTYHVTAGDIARFLSAVRGAAVDALTIDEAPASFYAALDPVERRDLDLDGFVQNLPFRKTGGGNAFNEVCYVRPIRAGDTVVVTTRYTDVYEKKGKSGSLLFRVRENELRDAEGELIGTTRCGHVMAFDLNTRVETTA